MARVSVASSTFAVRKMIGVLSRKWMRCAVVMPSSEPLRWMSMTTRSGDCASVMAMAGGEPGEGALEVNALAHEVGGRRLVNGDALLARPRHADDLVAEPFQP